MLGAELGTMSTRRFALLVEATAGRAAVGDTSSDGFDVRIAYSLIGALRVWPHRRIWVQGGLGIGIMRYNDEGANGVPLRGESLGAGFQARVGGGVEVLSFARASLGVSLVVDGFFQSATSIYTPVIAVSLRYYTGLGTGGSSGPCNFDPSKGCTN